MSANGQPQAAPVFPWEIVLRNSTTFFEPIGGGMVLAICPVAASEDRQTMIPPMIRVVFNEAGWKAFQAKVAADGGRSSIQVAKLLPPDPPRP